MTSCSQLRGPGDPHSCPVRGGLLRGQDLVSVRQPDRGSLSGSANPFVASSGKHELELLGRFIDLVRLEGHVAWQGLSTNGRRVCADGIDSPVCSIMSTDPWRKSVRCRVSVTVPAGDSTGRKRWPRRPSSMQVVAMGSRRSPPDNRRPRTAPSLPTTSSTDALTYSRGSDSKGSRSSVASAPGSWRRRSGRPVSILASSPRSLRIHRPVGPRSEVRGPARFRPA